MYWRDNQLHVALKSNSDLDTVKANLASQGNATINNYVVVEPSQYSQTEYDVIESNFRNYYSKNEKGGNIIAVFPDVENNQLYAVVSTASKETQQGISKVFGSKVKNDCKTLIATKLRYTLVLKGTSKTALSNAVFDIFTT